MRIDVTALEVRPCRDRRNLDEAAAQHEIGLGGCANRRIGFENLPVYLVHRIEVTHISKVNVRGDHVLVAHASGLEYGSNIFESLFRLRFNASSDDPAAGVGPHRSCDVIQIAGFDSRAEGDPRNLEPRWGNNLLRLRNPSYAGCSHGDNNVNKFFSFHDIDSPAWITVCRSFLPS